MHIPVISRDEFKGATKFGNMADALVQMDTDFGAMLDFLDEIGVTEDTVVMFTGDNGADDDPDSRGNSGFFEGSYFTGSEGAFAYSGDRALPGPCPRRAGQR